jgi:zinc protease
LQTTLKNFISEGPSAQELIEAKLNILGGFPLLFDSNRAILSNLTLLGFYQLPLNYFDTYKQNIETISALDIQEAFKRRIHPNDMLTVMVGQ